MVKSTSCGTSEMGKRYDFRVDISVLALFSCSHYYAMRGRHASFSQQRVLKRLDMKHASAKAQRAAKLEVGTISESCLGCCNSLKF
jgi:hypothetical protein